MGGWRLETVYRNLQALCKLYNVKLDDLLDESNEEVPIEKPECQKVECDIERKDKGKRHVWAKRGVIAAMILALAVCCIFWYMSTKKGPF